MLQQNKKTETKSFGVFGFMCFSLGLGPCIKLVSLPFCRGRVLRRWRIVGYLMPSDRLKAATSTGQATPRQDFLGHCRHCACRSASRGHSKSGHLASSGRTLPIPKQGTFYCGLGKNNLLLMSNGREGHLDENRLLLPTKCKTRRFGT